MSSNRSKKRGIGKIDGRKKRDRVGTSDPLVCLPAVSDGERSPNRNRKRECGGGDGRRNRIFYGGISEAKTENGLDWMKKLLEKVFDLFNGKRFLKVEIPRFLDE